MAASVEYRHEGMSSGETKEKEKGDDLSLFVEFNGVNLNLDLLQKSSQIQVAFDSETKSIIHGQDFVAAEDLLNSMNNITDYDWLLSPPRHPVPSLEIEEQITLTDHTLISNGQSTSPESKLENTTADVTSTTNVSSSNGAKHSSTIRRPSPSRKAGSRSATPTTRVTVIAATKPAGPLKRSTTPTPRPPVLAKPAARSSTPIQRPSVTVTAKSASRSSTPIQRPSVTAFPKSTSRSSTPTQRPPVTVTASAKSASRSTTPTQRPSSAKSASRSSTPTQQPSVTTTASVKSASRSSTPTQRPSAIVTASAKSASRSSTPTQRPSVTVTAKSASRSSTPTLRSSNASNGGVKSVRGYSNGDDDVNPVLMGTQMVERVVNMRKLAPPREDRVSDHDNTSGKLSVSQNNSGFGRSLSKKSFDMALRHLDIRRSMPGNMRASITKVPASSVYSVRPESIKTRTSSSGSSEDGGCKP